LFAGQFGRRTRNAKMTAAVLPTTGRLQATAPTTTDLQRTTTDRERGRWRRPAPASGRATLAAHKRPGRGGVPQIVARKLEKWRFLTRPRVGERRETRSWNTGPGRRSGANQRAL